VLARREECSELPRDVSQHIVPVVLVISVKTCGFGREATYITIFCVLEKFVNVLPNRALQQLVVSRGIPLNEQSKVTFLVFNWRYSAMGPFVL
jgi:hypothetical protein